MYYEDLLEIIDDIMREIDGQEVKKIFKEKFGSGSEINMNKALRRLREHKKVGFRKEGVRIFYWSMRLRKRS